MKSENIIHESEKWGEEFTSLYEEATQRYAGGIRSAENLFMEDEGHFLESIGATRQEIYDFIEDWQEVGEPDPETVLQITAVRRDFFLQEQGCVPSQKNHFDDCLTPNECITWWASMVATYYR